jgi:hypothetical protein
MTSFPTRLAAASILALTPLLASAQPQPEVPQPSPKARVEQRVGVTDFSVDYSSPGVKGRVIWGDLVPYDKVWRTGANAATKLTVSRDFHFGDKLVPAGSYALFTIPTREDWTVILSSNPNAWSTTPYDDSQDVARITVKPEPLPAPRERMTFIFSDTTNDRTNLDLEWEKLRIRIPLSVDTNAFVQANIDKAVSDAWRPHFISARYLLDNGGDLKRALEYVNTSIAIKPTWWNHWVKAQIQGKMGKKSDARKTAEQAKKLGKGDATFERFFAAQVDQAIKNWK